MKVDALALKLIGLTSKLIFAVNFSRGGLNWGGFSAARLEALFQ